MKLSVVLPCLNAAATLDSQLEALASQQYDGPWELIFADNGSEDQSLDVLLRYRTRLPCLKLVDASRIKGPGYAKNRGVQAATGALVAFVDADDMVGKGYLQAMARALTEHPLVACRSDGSQLNPPGLQWTAQEWGLQRLWYPPWSLHAAGGTIGVRKALFEKLGGFDSTLLYLEDTDFCIKAQLAGETLHFAGDALMHYRNRRSFGDLARQSARWSANHVILAKRYGSKSDARRIYWESFVKDWWKIGKLAARVRDPQARRELAWWLGRQVGRSSGLFRHRGPPV